MDMDTTDTTTPITTDITDALDTHGDGWKPKWAACKNAMTDTYGNSVAIHDQGETVLIEFEYALGGVVETMHLDPRHGAQRIAGIINALAAAPVE